MLYGILSQNEIAESINGEMPLTDSLFFTTDRTIGRDPQLISEAIRKISPDFAAFDATEKSSDNEENTVTMRFARPHQTHTDRILRIQEDFFSLTETEREAMMEGIDAIITDVRNACFGISTADCIPVLVYDPEHHCAAAIHAGWRGTVQRIVEKTLHEMHKAYGTKAEKCEAVVGPGISQDSFEVGWEVHKAFEDAGFDMQPFTKVMPSRDGNGTKPHLALKEINSLQLLLAGLQLENLRVSSIDTFTDSRFFSARREQKGSEKCGRILSGFVMKSLP